MSGPPKLPPPPVPPRAGSVLVDAPYTIYSFAQQIDQGSASSRTLIISTHGSYTNQTFPLPGWTHVMFCTPKDSALRADLRDAVRGDISGVGMPNGTKSCADFNLTHFEHDPAPGDIRNSLKGNTDIDVLVLQPGGRGVLLSTLVAWLKAKNLTYPRLQGLFCRVDATGSTPSYSFTGKTSATTSIVHEAKFNMQKIANEIKSRNLSP